LNDTASKIICQRLESLKQRFERRSTKVAASETDEMMNRMLLCFIDESWRLADQYFASDEPRFAGRSSLNRAEGREAEQALRVYAEAAMTLEDLLEQVEVEFADPENDLTTLFTRMVRRDCREISEIKDMLDDSLTIAEHHIDALRKPSGPRLVFSKSAPGLH